MAFPQTRRMYTNVLLLDRIDDEMSLVVNLNVDRYDQAARVIQRRWRRWVNMAPFRWCKAMLYHAEHSDTPQSLLKLIAPADSNIVDDAAGVRIRLRLGVHSDQDGEKLAIFYKIFTVRTVIDLCASSPKKYADSPAFIHRTNVTFQSKGDSSYVRKENNPWRVVAWDALRSTAGMVAQARITNHTVKNFNFDCKTRKQNQMKKYKQKYRKWMTTLYRDSGTCQSNYPYFYIPVFHIVYEYGCAS